MSSGTMTGKGGFTQTSPSFEGLEPRLLLSGNVTAYVAAGDLYLVGDSSDNDVIVTNTGAGNFEVTPGATIAGTTINGGTDPVDLTDAGNSIFAFLDVGNDRLEITTGAPASLGEVTANVPGDIFVSDPLGDNAVLIHDITVGGNVTVVNGLGAQDVEVQNATVGSLFVMNSGNIEVPRDIPSGMDTYLLLSGVTTSGDVTVINGAGSDQEQFSGTTVNGNVTINNGPDGAYAAFDGVTINGSLTVIKGPGGSILAPDIVPNSNGNVTVAGYVEVDGATVSGNVYLHGSVGVDEFYLNDLGVGGTLFIDGSAGPLAVTMDNFEIAGTAIIKGEGTTDLLPTPTTDGASLGQPSDQLSTAVYIGLNSAVPGVGSDSISTANNFGGDVLIWMDQGNDLAVVENTEFVGNLTVADGNDAGELGVENCVLDQSLVFVKGDGGALSSLSNVGANQPVGQLPSVISSVFELIQSEVQGNVTVINGIGNDAFIIELATISGNFFASNGMGAVDSGMLETEVDGSVTFINAGGAPFAPALAQGDPSPVVVTEIAFGTAFFGSAGPVGATYDTVIKGNVTIINGAGIDVVAVQTSEIDGNLYVNNGPDGALLMVDSSLIGGFLIDLRGDGGSIGPTGQDADAASDSSITGSEVDGFTLIINGAGDDEVDASTTDFKGDVSIYNGLDDQYVDLAGTFEGNVTVIDTASSFSQIYTGGNSVATTTIGGNLILWTGFGDDSVRMSTTTVTGTTDIRTFLGNDTVAIDDSTFTGTVFVDTGVPAAVAGTDADTINIEQSTGTSMGTSFAATLTMQTGADDDTVNIGVADNTTGLGSTTNNCFADFAVSASLDGGDGSDTLNYLLNGNIFEDDATIDAVNVETIV